MYLLKTTLGIRKCSSTMRTSRSPTMEGCGPAGGRGGLLVNTHTPVKTLPYWAVMTISEYLYISICKNFVKSLI